MRERHDDDLGLHDYGSDRYPDRLPPTCHLAWLTSSEMKDGCGSQLFVVCWTDDHDEPLSKLVSEALRNVVWEEHAQDYWL